MFTADVHQPLLIDREETPVPQNILSICPILHLCTGSITCISSLSTAGMLLLRGFDSYEVYILGVPFEYWADKLLLMPYIRLRRTPPDYTKSQGQTSLATGMRKMSIFARTIHDTIMTPGPTRYPDLPSVQSHHCHAPNQSVWVKIDHWQLATFEVGSDNVWAHDSSPSIWHQGFQIDLILFGRPPKTAVLFRSPQKKYFTNPGTNLLLSHDQVSCERLQSW